MGFFNQINGRRDWARSRVARAGVARNLHYGKTVGNDRAFSPAAMEHIKGGAVASWQIGTHELHVEPGFTDSKGLDESLGLMGRLRPFV